MQVGELCECCNKEAPAGDLEYLYVAIKKQFMKTCGTCRSKYVTFTPAEWNGNESAGDMPVTAPN